MELLVLLVGELEDDGVFAEALVEFAAFDFFQEILVVYLHRIFAHGFDVIGPRMEEEDVEGEAGACDHQCRHQGDAPLECEFAHCAFPSIR